MNYPFANAIVDFLKGGDAKHLLNTVLDICENYPPCAVKLLMNHIGTHDTARILTRLGTNETFNGDRESQSRFELNDYEYKNAVKLLKLAAVLQYTLPGVPSIYYGDEAGVTGFGDPFCRKTYPWGKENTELVDFYKLLGKIRRASEAFKEGEFVPVTAENGLICFLRTTKDAQVFVAVNRNDFEQEIPLPKEFKKAKSQMGQKAQSEKLVLPPFGFIIITA